MSADAGRPHRDANRHDRTDLHHRRRAHAVPQVAQPARALRGVRSRDGRRPRAPRAPAVRADRARRGDPGLRGAVGRRGEHRPRRGAADGLRDEGARLDRDAQLRVGHAGARFRDQQHPRGALEPRARRRRRRAVARAAPLLRRDGAVALELVRREDARPARGARREVQARLPRAGDRHHEGPHRSDGGPADGPDRGERRVPVRHHAARDGRIRGAEPRARARGAEGGALRRRGRAALRREGHALRAGRRRARGFDRRESREAPAVLRPQVRQRHGRQQLADHRRRRVAA